MIVYELAENETRRGLFLSEAGAMRRAQEILDGYAPLVVSEAEARAEVLARDGDPEEELLLMEEFTTPPGEPLAWETEQHHLNERRRGDKAGPPVGPPVPTAWYSQRSCFTIHEREVSE